MAGRKRPERKSEDHRPVVTDDFIYNDPEPADFAEAGNEPVSDTPEEAIRKLRRRKADAVPDPEPADSSAEPDVSGESAASGQSTVYSSGIMLDENLQPVQPAGKKIRRFFTAVRFIPEGAFPVFPRTVPARGRR